MSWTEEQLQAINKRGANILVSAAAGSGKTSVLVERIITKVIEEKVDVDKILVVTTMLLLTERGTLPAWIPIVTIFREFLVSGYRLVEAKEGGNVVAANIWGKIKTVTQMIAIMLMLIDSNKFFAFRATNLPMPLMILNILGSIMMLISVIATIFSGYTYLKNGKDLFKDR